MNDTLKILVDRIENKAKNKALEALSKDFKGKKFRISNGKLQIYHEYNLHLVTDSIFIDAYKKYFKGARELIIELLLEKSQNNG